MFLFKNHRRKIFFWLIVFCFALLALISFWFLFGKFKNTDPVPQTATELLDRVGQLVLLPTGEEPTIATVTDLTELQKQEFFHRAKVGDKVIIYIKAGKAILYSPVEDKIVEMAPLNKNLLPQ